MKNEITGILITPLGGSRNYGRGLFQRVTLKKGSIEDIYKHLKCNLFDVVQLDNDNSIYVDDEGLLKRKQKYFTIKKGKSLYVDDYHLAGRGLVLGYNRNTGDSKSTTLNEKEIRDLIQFETDGFTKEPYFEFVSLPNM